MTQDTTNSFFAIIAQEDARHLSSILKNGLNVQKIKKTNSLKRMLYAVTQYKDIDLVFIDFDLFREKAFVLLEKVRFHNNCKKIRFVLIGTTSTKKLLLKAADVGYSGFLSKPIDEQTVLEKVAKLLPAPDISNDKRMKLIENIEATLRFKNKEAVGTIEDIGVGGCMVSTPYFDRIGIEIFDIVTIRVQVDNDRFGVNAVVVKMEKQEKIGFNAINISMEFSKPDEQTALNFAKLWAYVLHK